MPRRHGSYSPVISSSLSLTLVVLLTTVAAAPTRSASGVEGMDTRAPSGQLSKTEITTTSGFPLLFVENQGQWRSDLVFQAQTPDTDLFFTRQALLIQTHGGTPDRATIRLRPLDPEPDMRLTPGGERATRVSYFRGRDPARWHTDIAAFASVIYQGVYAGIDLVFRGEDRRMAYDLVLEPGAAPSQVRLELEGVKNLTLDDQGAMIMTLPNGLTMRQRSPFIYQESGGRRLSVGGGFVILDSDPERGRHVFGFQLAEYDPDLRLVIDPTLDYSSFVGGTRDDEVEAMAVTSDGEVIVVGSTRSADFPGVPITFGTQARRDALIYRVNADGDNLDFVALLSGSLDEQANAVALGSDGSIYLTGQTTSDNFPTRNALYPVRPGASQTSFVTKLSSTGNTMLFSTYFGGTGIDAGQAIGLDDSGNLYVAGKTTSVDMMVRNALYPRHHGGGNDGFLLKMKDDGSTLDLSTYFGGTVSDSIDAISVTAAGDVYLGGTTSSRDLPVRHAIQAENGGAADAFVARIATAGPELVFCSYLGGGGNESLAALVPDQLGHLLLAGDTSSSDFPVKNALYANPGGKIDAFVGKLDHSGRFLHFATYLGGSGDDRALAAALDQTDDASDGLRYLYLGGETHSNQFPTENPDQSWYAGNQDGFLAKLDPRGLRMTYSSYFGGTRKDGIAAMGSQPSAGTRDVFLVGNTTSNLAGLFPVGTNPPYQADNAGGMDHFVAHVEQIDNDPLTPVLGLAFKRLTPEKDGATVEIDLTLDDPGSIGISAFSSQIHYDINELEYTRVVWDTALPATAVTNIDTSFPGRLVLTLYQNGTPTALSGAMGKLEFTVRDVGRPTSPPRPSKQTILTQDQSWAADLSGRSTFIQGVAGGMLLERRCNDLLGDCDCSGLVRIWEVQSAVLTNLLPAASQPNCVKRDYVQMVPTDLTEIINNFLDRVPEAVGPTAFEPPGSEQDPLVEGSARPTLRFGPARSTKTGAITTKLILNTRDKPISILTTEITYDPKLFSRVRASIGPAARAAAKRLVFKVVEPGTLRVLIYGINKELMGDGTIAKIRLVPKVDLGERVARLRNSPMASSPSAKRIRMRGDQLRL